MFTSYFSSKLMYSKMKFSVLLLSTLAYKFSSYYEKRKRKLLGNPHVKLYCILLFRDTFPHLCVTSPILWHNRTTDSINLLKQNKIKFDKMFTRRAGGPTIQRKFFRSIRNSTNIAIYVHPRSSVKPNTRNCLRDENALELERKKYREENGSITYWGKQKWRIFSFNTTVRRIRNDAFAFVGWKMNTKWFILEIYTKRMPRDCTYCLEVLVDEITIFVDTLTHTSNPHCTSRQRTPMGTHGAQYKQKMCVLLRRRYSAPPRERRRLNFEWVPYGITAS